MATSKVWTFFLLFKIASTNSPLQDLSNANNLFAVSLFKTIHQNLGPSDTKSFILSPVSAQSSLAFLQSGCKGETGEEIRTALHLPNRPKIEEGFKRLIPIFKGLRNKMYMKKDAAARRSFKVRSKRVYGAQIENIDFGKRKQAYKIMNRWIQKSTKNEIRNIVDSDTLNSNSSVVVLSAFYFKAKWSQPFTFTKKKLFHLNPSDNISVDTMFQNSLYNFSENPQLDAKFLELPLRQKDASMVIVLPNTINGFESLQKQIELVLEPQTFTKRRLNLALPKFKIETRIHLKTVLQHMNVGKVFEKEEADLSAIAGRRGSLVVGDLLQKVVIRVGEGGVNVPRTKTVKGNSSTDSHEEFVVDRPFLYYLKIRNFIACVSRVLNPTRSK